MDASPTAEQAAAEQQMLLNGPAASPPPGMTSNFIDSRTLDANVWAAATILTLLTTVTGFARLYTKARLIRSVAYEDCKSSSRFLLLCLMLMYQGFSFWHGYQYPHGRLGCIVLQLTNYREVKWHILLLQSCSSEVEAELICGTCS